VVEVSLAKKYGRLDVRDVLASFRKHGAQQTNGAKVRDWCEDSIFLLERICELYEQDAPGLYESGLVHFAIHNYELASHIQDIGERYRTYLKIHRRFEGRLSPVTYSYRRLRRRVRTALGKKKRAAVRLLASSRDSL